MPLLFSYGTLQQEDVQLATFGRRLEGRRDELPRAKLTHAGPHRNVVFQSDETSSVSGTAFEVSDAELAAVDAYERQFDYARVIATLKSGRRAWVYVHTPK